MIRKITNQEVFNRCSRVAGMLREQFPTSCALNCYPVPHGGVPPAYALGEAMFAMGCELRLVDTPEEADFILDDLIITGDTADSYFDTEKTFFALFSRHPDSEDLSPEEDVVFPWEAQ